MSFPRVFVTVGTTQFEELIDALNTSIVAGILHDLGCRELTIQFGTGKKADFSNYYKSIKINAFATKPSISEDIQYADLVISHAGAGSIIETMKAGKPLVVVVNELLMNNHQTELAERMSEDGHALYCVPSELEKTLDKLPEIQLRPYEKGNTRNFTKELNRLMGFE